MLLYGLFPVSHPPLELFSTDYTEEGMTASTGQMGRAADSKLVL